MGQQVLPGVAAIVAGGILSGLYTGMFVQEDKDEKRERKRERGRKCAWVGGKGCGRGCGKGATGRWLKRVYEPCVGLAIRVRLAVLGCAVVATVAASPREGGHELTFAVCHNPDLDFDIVTK